MRKPLLKFARVLGKLLVVIGLVAGAWLAYEYYLPEEEETGLGALPTAVAEVRDITVSVEATGVLQPIKVVEIKSKASGEVLRMPVEVGDFVAAGDLIAQIDTQILDQELKQVAADYESAVIRLDIARNQYERARSLFAQDLISENELETSQQNFTSAEAQMLRNEASLELARERLADATVRAPSAGTIIAKTVEEGQIIASSTNNVSGGTTLVQMADLSQLQVRTLVDEVDIGQVRSGLEVESRVEAFPDERFSGHVIMIEPQAVVQQSVTTFPVLSRIDNQDAKLLPGMNADVSIVVHRKPQVLALPNEAVRTPGDAAEVMRMLGLLADADADSRARAGAGERAGGRGDGGGEGAARAGRQRGGRPGDRGNGAFDPSALRRPTRTDSGATDGVTEEPGDQADTGFSGSRRKSAGFGGDAADDPFGIGGRREQAVVFTKDELGRIVTRDIVVGGRDWEYTEVLAGIAAGEQVLVLPSTSLLRSQDRLRSWAQGRSGIPGMGGDGPPSGGGRRGR